MPPSSEDGQQENSSPPLVNRASNAINGGLKQEDGNCVPMELTSSGDSHEKTRRSQSYGNEKITEEVFLSEQNQNQLDSSSDMTISTALKLYDESWITKLSVPDSNRPESSTDDFLNVCSNISAMKNYTKEDEEDEKRNGVSTKLTLYSDPWMIRKSLTQSDLGNLARLLMKTNVIKTHVLPLMREEILTRVESREGAAVMVFDQDTMTEHKLVFKQWVSSRSYIFIGRWGKDFVRRRELREGDEIGLYWDPYCSRFNFRVLNRAPLDQQQAA